MSATAPASAGTITCWDAAISMPSARTTRSPTGARRDRIASAIGPSSWCHRGHVSDLVIAREDRCTGLRQHGIAAVEVECGQPARRMTEVVHLRDGLLPAVAPLVQVDRAADPIGLMGQRALVHLGRPARAPCRDPQRLSREVAGEGAPIERTGESISGFRREDGHPPGEGGGGMVCDLRVLVSSGTDALPRVGPDEGDAVRGERGSGHDRSDGSAVDVSDQLQV